MTDLPPQKPVQSLTLTVTPSARLRNEVAARLISHEMGRLRNGAVPAVPALGALLLAVPAGWLIGVSLSDAATIGLYSFAGAAIGFLLLRRGLKRRALGGLSGSALSNRPMTLDLDETGVTIAAQTLPWSTVLRIDRYADNTLILFSAADGLVIPDADLPDGMSPRTLADLVAKWKAG